MTNLEMAAALRRAGYIVTGGDVPMHFRSPASDKRQRDKREDRKRERRDRPSGANQLARLAAFVGVKAIGAPLPTGESGRIRASLGRVPTTRAETHRTAVAASRTASYSADAGPADAVKLARTAGMIR